MLYRIGLISTIHVVAPLALIVRIVLLGFCSYIRRKPVLLRIRTLLRKVRHDGFMGLIPREWREGLASGNT